MKALLLVASVWFALALVAAIITGCTPTPTKVVTDIAACATSGGVDTWQTFADRLEVRCKNGTTITAYYWPGKHNNSTSGTP